MSAKATQTEPKSWIAHMLANHPGVFLSGMYILASLIGMIYSWAFLRGFGINVFHYAEISDFLLASLKEPFTWVIFLGAMLLMLADNAVSRRVQARKAWRFFGWYASEKYRVINYIVTCVILGVFLNFYAEENEDNVRAGDGEKVTIELSDDSPAMTTTMLGTTGRFVFVFDHESSQVGIFPHESISKITKPAP